MWTVKQVIIKLEDGRDKTWIFNNLKKKKIVLATTNNNRLFPDQSGKIILQLSIQANTSEFRYEPMIPNF